VAVRQRFRDAAGLMGPVDNPYSFQINHSDEEAIDQTRSVTRTAVTTGPQFVIQQGEPSPRILRYNGTILDLKQLDAFQAYYNACATRTIFFLDVQGIEYEVLIQRFAPQRKRTLRNPREPTLMWYWSYNLEMEIIE
jgi:hypothetical protein